MKKFLSLLLAVLTVVTLLVPAFSIPAVAEDAPAEPATKYVVYEQDFENVNSDTTGTALMEALGWVIPMSKAGIGGATYSIHKYGTNKSLRVDSLNATENSFINIFSGDAMSVLRNGNFTLTYRLTYAPETTNADGYASVIYNYNEMHGSVADSTGNEVYGIVAVRMCGTGFNSVYYPAKGSACAYHSLERQVGSPNVMANRYDTAVQQPSLYSRLFNVAEEDDTVRTGTAVMANKVLDVKIVYAYASGVTVYINDQLVSETLPSFNYNADVRDTELWNDFVTRNKGAAVALLTTPGVVADIDDIVISTTDITAESVNAKMPALVITEICGAPDPAWAEFIEIYNPNDFAVDVANYSLIRYDSVVDGTALDAIEGNRKVNFSSYVNLGEVFGSVAKGKDVYKSEADIAKMDARTYEYIDDNKYSYDGKKYNVDPNGANRYIRYIDNWNTRYVRGSDDYDTNTMLNPGDTLVIHFKETGYQPAWDNLTNDGSLDQKIASKGFRYTYKNYGLSADTKVLVYSGFNIPDGASLTYMIGKACDDNGDPINYAGKNDMTYIESYARWLPIIATGKVTFTTNTADTSNFGQAGYPQGGYSACYVYGVDASGDYRCGTIYTNQNNTKKSATAHVGSQAGYQDLIIGSFYQRTVENPELMITELMPRTNNLEGKDLTAFSAMEITNTSTLPIDIYDYALVRTDLGVACSRGAGFSRRVELRPGNPVDKVEGNGAYYYFAEAHLNNPEECVLQPGETMVVWFITDGTYQSYYDDLDFGEDYFRQYWAENGCPEMAMKNGDGEYAVKVIATDGCDVLSYNASMSEKVFSISSSQSAVYGIAYATDDVLDNAIYETDIVSIAYFGLTATYYQLNKRAIEAADASGDIYYANILESEFIPANVGMRYVTGLTYSNRISAMKQSLKVQYAAFASGNSYYHVNNPDGGLKITYKTSNALQPAGLGVLEDEEVYGVKDTLFQASTEGEELVYRYFEARRNVVTTLEGAAVKIGSKTSTELRFDNAIRKDVYTALASTYGKENLKVGMLVCRTADLVCVEETTHEGFENSEVVYVDVNSDLLYYSEDFAVLGSSIIVGAAEFGTEFTAIGYMQVTTADGTVHTYYSGTSASRSVEDVAKAALKDVKFAQDEVYAHRYNGRYSRYTAEERAALIAYAG